MELPRFLSVAIALEVARTGDTLTVYDCEGNILAVKSGRVIRRAPSAPSLLEQEEAVKFLRASPGAGAL